MTRARFALIASALLFAGCTDFEMPERPDDPIRQLDVSPNPAKAGASLLISFVAAGGEGDPEVGLLGAFATKTYGPGPGSEYQYRYVVTGHEPQGQAIPVSVTLRRGGRLFTQASIDARFDFAPPRLVSATARSPRYAAGEAMVVDLVADEPILAPRAMLGSRELACSSSDAATSAPQLFACSLSVTGDEPPGPVDLAIALEDLAGNQAAASATGVTFFDFGSPLAVEDLSVSPDHARRGTEVVVSFRTDRALSDESTVTIAGLPAAQLRHEAGDSGHRWSFSRTIGEADVENEEAEVVVEARDALGGSARGEAALVLDFTPPTVREPLLPSPLKVGPGRQLELTVEPTEPLASLAATAGFPQLNLPMECERAAGPAWVCKLTSTGLEPEGPQSIVLALTDLAGNSGGFARADVFWFDFTCGQDEQGSPLLTRKHSRLELSAGEKAFEPGSTVELFSGSTLLGSAVCGADGSLAPTPFPGTEASDPWVRETDAAGNVCAPRRPGVRFVAGFDGKLPGQSAPNPDVLRAVALEQLVMPKDWLDAQPEADASAYASVVSRDDQVILESTEPAVADTEPRWVEIPGSSQAGLRARHSMAFDPRRRETLLVGGSCSDPNLRGTTWSWNGFAWSQKQVSALPPRELGSMVFTDYQGSDTVHLFAGNSEEWADYWTWDGSSWLSHGYIGFRNADLAGHAACSSPSGHPLVYGGTGNPTTIDLDMTELQYAGSPRRGHAMVLDEARQQAMAFGGETQANGAWTCSADTLVWRGNRWETLSPAASPSARRGASMVYDNVRGLVVLFGGQRCDGTILNEVWEWDGANWRQRSPSAMPTPRVSAAMAWDSYRGRGVLYGGTPPGMSGPIPDVWEYAYPFRWPAVTATFSLAAVKDEISQAIAQGTDPAITVRAVVSAEGASESAAGQQGAILMLWSWVEGAWQQPDDGDPVSGLVEQRLYLRPEYAPSYTPFISESGELRVLLRSAGGASAAGAARLSVDLLEVSATLGEP